MVFVCSGQSLCKDSFTQGNLLSSLAFTLSAKGWRRCGYNEYFGATSHPKTEPNTTIWCTVYGALNVALPVQGWQRCECSGCTVATSHP